MALYLLWWSSFWFSVSLGEAGAVHTSVVRNGVCHSCAKGGVSTSCFCDNRCAFYKDCCFDSPAIFTKRREQTKVRFSCLRGAFGEGFYAIDQCLNNWNGTLSARHKCKSHEDNGDMFISVPVVDTNTNITYRNRYCAECNGVDLSNLSSFSLEIRCDNLLYQINNSYGNITEDFMLQNLIYENYSWGVYYMDQTLGVMLFSHCWLTAKLPADLSLLLRGCQTNMVSTCSAEWNDDLLQQCCTAFHMNIVYDKFARPYRNIYCAACNYVPLNETHCEPSTTGGGGFGLGQPLPSFTMLLDINSISRKIRCSVSEIYDSRSEKCRRLICTEPDERPYYGECVKRVSK